MKHKKRNAKNLITKKINRTDHDFETCELRDAVISRKLKQNINCSIQLVELYEYYFNL